MGNDDIFDGDDTHGTDGTDGTDDNHDNDDNLGKQGVDKHIRICLNVHVFREHRRNPS
ncbi:MAG: hypothetical protein J5775_04355 [Spirochaetales bacterium]|nr:hypothetical protein [Spirochaetales bacterium]